MTTDQHSPEPIRSWLSKKRIAVDYRPWNNENKRDAYAKLKIGLTSGDVELPDDEGLIDELIGLEARPTPTGLTRIAAAGSGHDDLAIAVAALAARFGRQSDRAADRDLLVTQMELRGEVVERTARSSSTARPDGKYVTQDDLIRNRAAGLADDGSEKKGKKYDDLIIRGPHPLGTRLRADRWPWE